MIYRSIKNLSVLTVTLSTLLLAGFVYASAGRILTIDGSVTLSAVAKTASMILTYVEEAQGGGGVMSRFDSDNCKSWAELSINNDGSATVTVELDGPDGAVDVYYNVLNDGTVDVVLTSIVATDTDQLISIVHNNSNYSFSNVVKPWDKATIDYLLGFTVSFAGDLSEYESHFKNGNAALTFKILVNYEAAA